MGFAFVCPGGFCFVLPFDWMVFRPLWINGWSLLVFFVYVFIVLFFFTFVSDFVVPHQHFCSPRL